MPQYASKILTVIAVVAVGMIMLSISKADTPAPVASNDPNNVIVQFSLPHIMRPRSTTSLEKPMISPFTLYGNGLLVCGHSDAMPYATSGMPMMTMEDSPVPTATKLSEAQIAALIQEIATTGFFKLDHEYFRSPDSAMQRTLRVSLLQAEHYVLFYNDTPPPPAYTATLSILEKRCETVTTPYQSGRVVLRTLKRTADSNPSLPSVDTLDIGDKTPVKHGLRSADSQKIKVKDNPATQKPTVPTVGESNEVITGSAASDLTIKLRKSTGQLVSDGGSTYEIGVTQTLPTIKNKLSVNYNELRKKKTGTSISDKLQSLLFSKKAYAEGSRPVRVVYLLAADGGDTSQLAVAQRIGQADHDWYCRQVSTCYTYQGVQVVRGSQTMGGYQSCHADTVLACSGSALSQVLHNVYQYDRNTIYRDDVDTLVVTSWAVGSKEACGYGFVGFNLSTVDPYHSADCTLNMDGAHEIGHTFGLNHTGNGTLMDGTPYTQFSANCDIANYFMPDCTLDAGQVNTLRLATPLYFSFVWPGWDQVAGANTTHSAPAAVSWGPGRIDLFVRGLDNAVYWKNYSGSWSDWSRISEPNTTYDAPAVASRGPGILDLAVRGTNNQIYYKRFYTGVGWSNWSYLGGGPTYSPPSMASPSQNLLVLVARKADNSVSQIVNNNGTWGGWNSISNPNSTYNSPALVSPTPGRLDMFVTGTNNLIYQKTSTSSGYVWGQFAPLTYAAATTSAPAVASPGSNIINLVVRGTDNSIYHKYYNGSAWTEWNTASYPSTSVAPAATSWGVGRVDIFVAGGDTAVYHKAH